MGKRRPGSGRRGFGLTDLQIRRAVNGRMETAEELVEKVLKNFFFFFKRAIAIQRVVRVMNEL